MELQGASSLSSSLTKCEVSLRDRMVLISSKKDISTLTFVLADVSKYVTFQLFNTNCIWESVTWRFSSKSHLLPTKTIGFISCFLREEYDL